MTDVARAYVWWEDDKPMFVVCEREGGRVVAASELCRKFYAFCTTGAFFFFLFVWSPSSELLNFIIAKNLYI